MFSNSARFLMFSAVVAAGPVLGQDNELYLLQDSTSSPSQSNTLFVDQSLASSSLVAGDMAGDVPATQVGGGNSGDIVVSGENVSVLFSQGAVDAPAFGNTASVTASGANVVATLGQTGLGNSATLSIGANATTIDSSGTLIQTGNGNAGALSVDGTNMAGTLIQTGNNNVSDFAVSGRDSNVTYEIIGNGLSTASTGPSVFTNAGTVTVRQSVPGSN